MLDAIVDRREMRQYLIKALNFLSPGASNDA